MCCPGRNLRIPRRTPSSLLAAEADLPFPVWLVHLAFREALAGALLCQARAEWRELSDHAVPPLFMMVSSRSYAALAGRREACPVSLSERCQPGIGHNVLLWPVPAALKRCPPPAGCRCSLYCLHATCHHLLQGTLLALSPQMPSEQWHKTAEETTSWPRAVGREQSPRHLTYSALDIPLPCILSAQAQKHQCWPRGTLHSR